MPRPGGAARAHQDAQAAARPAGLGALRGPPRHRGRPPRDADDDRVRGAPYAFDERRAGRRDVRLAACARRGASGSAALPPRSWYARSSGGSAASWATTRPTRPTSAMSAASATACPDPVSGESRGGNAASQPPPVASGGLRARFAPLHVRTRISAGSVAPRACPASGLTLPVSFCRSGRPGIAPPVMTVAAPAEPAVLRRNGR